MYNVTKEMPKTSLKAKNTRDLQLSGRRCYRSDERESNYYRMCVSVSWQAACMLL